MRSLIIAEHDNQSLNVNILNVITAAAQLNAEISVLIAGHNCQAVVAAAQELPVITQVIVAEHPRYAHFLAEELANLLMKIAPHFTYVLTPATTFGKNFLPRLAAMLDVQPISDVISIVAADTFQRPIYAGNAIETVQTQEQQKLITIRSTAFAAAAATAHELPASRQISVLTADQLAQELATNAKIGAHGDNTHHDNVNEIAAKNLSTFVSLDHVKSTRPELTSARVVISGGRGLQNAENFKMLEQLADKLNAAIGATRAAVDAGFVPNDLQVGQTGKVVAPELYIAIGISGAIQHLAGMKDSKVIVAINKDEEAPIFQVADYWLVGDLFEIVPQLIAALG